MRREASSISSSKQGTKAPESVDFGASGISNEACELLSIVPIVLHRFIDFNLPALPDEGPVDGPPDEAGELVVTEV